MEKCSVKPLVDFLEECPIKLIEELQVEVQEEFPIYFLEEFPTKLLYQFLMKNRKESHAIEFLIYFTVEPIEE